MKRKETQLITVGIVICSVILVILILYTYSNKEGFQTSNKIYIIMTTCLLEQDWERREKQYREGINTMLNYIKTHKTNHEVVPIIVENNSKSEKTFLNEFGIPVVYTHSNDIDKANANRSYIGKFEIDDIHNVMDKFNIHDDDFVVKFTGRYKLDKDCEFMNTLFQKGDTYDAIVKFGDFMNPVSHKMNNSITGLIGLRGKYVRKIQFKEDVHDQSIEHQWAEVAMEIPDERVYIPTQLGLHLWPGMGWANMSNITNFFKV